MATHTSPTAWWDQPEEVLMTVVDILDEVARAASGKTGKNDRDDRGEANTDGGS